MANPALNEKFLKKVSAFTDESKMTLEGTVNKTGILVGITILFAVLGWGQSSPMIYIGSLIVGLILSLIIIFKPQQAPLLAPFYAACEGLLLGGISAAYAFRYPGIVSNALILTFSCLAGMLVLYRFRIIRVTERFRSVLFAATLAVCLTYVADLVIGLFGSTIPLIHESSPLGIAFSGVVVLVAAFNLLLDFDMTEQAQARGAPKFMEWYCGFSILVTLVWLYLEILRLLGKINRK